MSIIKIEDGAITDVMPLNEPIDDSWIYVHDITPEYDPRYQTFAGYDYQFDANTNKLSVSTLVFYKPVSELKDLRIAELAEYRYNKEIGGTVFNDIPIPTDEDTQRKILGAQVSTLIDPNYTINNWKVGPDTYITLDAQMITAMSVLIRGHIQDCFDNSRIHTDAINALTTPQAVIDYDFTTGWPT